MDLPSFQEPELEQRSIIDFGGVEPSYLLEFAVACLILMVCFLAVRQVLARRKRDGARSRRRGTARVRGAIER